MKAGTITSLTGLPGRWSVWSKSDEGPGAHFFVPHDEAAHACDVKYAVVRVTDKRAEVKPELVVLRTEAKRATA